MAGRDAYDVIDELNRADVHLVVAHHSIRYHCRRDTSVPSGLLAELKQHKEQTIGVLLTIPAGCPVPHICKRLGICPREIDHSACTANAAATATTESEAA